MIVAVSDRMGTWAVVSSKSSGVPAIPIPLPCVAGGAVAAIVGIAGIGVLIRKGKKSGENT